MSSYKPDTLYQVADEKYLMEKEGKKGYWGNPLTPENITDNYTNISGDSREISPYHNVAPIVLKFFNTMGDYQYPNNKLKDDTWVKLGVDDNDPTNTNNGPEMLSHTNGIETIFKVQRETGYDYAYVKYKVEKNGNNLKIKYGFGYYGAGHATNKQYEPERYIAENWNDGELFPIDDIEYDPGTYKLGCNCLWIVHKSKLPDKNWYADARPHIFFLDFIPEGVSKVICKIDMYVTGGLLDHRYENNPIYLEIRKFRVRTDPMFI